MFVRPAAQLNKRPGVSMEESESKTDLETKKDGCVSPKWFVSGLDRTTRQKRYNQTDVGFAYPLPVLL